MNFPPNLFKSPQFKITLYNIDNISHNNLNIDNQLEFHQNLAKKLSKNIYTSKNFQFLVFSYMKSMTPIELIKICSINSKWLIDIVHQLILFSKLESQLLKFIETNGENREDFITFNKYFEQTESKFISLSKKSPEKDFGQTLIQNIRYLTININTEKNYKQYNNILTLSFDFLSKFEKLKETFLKISKEECFKFPIKVYQDNENGNNFNKTIYNFELPQWILRKECFTVPELFCAYFEQIILLHFQYDNLFHTKIIPFPFQNKLDEILDNENKIITFIENITEKNKLFSELNFTSISKKIKDDKYIKEVIDKRSNSDKIFSYYFEYNTIYKQTIEKQINYAQFKLHQSFFKNNAITFVENLYFTEDNIVGTTEDFVYKSICEQIYNLYCQQIANDLINDKIEEEVKIKKKRKKKHHKKNKKKKEGEKKEEKIKDLSNINNEDNKINKIEEIELNFEEKNINEELNNNELKEKNNKEFKKENLNEEKLEEKKNEDNKTENKNNNDKKDNKENNNIINNNENILNEEKNIDNNLNSNSNGGKNLSNTKDYIIMTNPKPKKEKKKKPFFLFPVTKTKKQKESNSDSEKNKNAQIKKDKKENEEIKKDINTSNINLSPEREKNIESSTQKSKIETQNINSPSLSTKHNSSSSNSPIFQNEQIDFSISYHFFFNNFVNNNFLYSNNNYIPKIYHKNSFYQNHLKNLISLSSSSINNFTNEILENTKNVNYHKELLSQFRLKYIEKITSLITSILNNNNYQFSISQYGSYISGLSIENSDVDIMIKLYDNSCINEIISILIKEFTNDEYKSFFSKINPIYTASVPVIKLECEIYDSITDDNIKNYFMNNYRYNINEIKKLKFDITFFQIDEKEKNNKQPSEKILDFINENINLYPNIIDIIYIMKRYIQAEKLNLSFKGGISSYSLFLLILAYIKSNKNNLKIPIGTLLIEFLVFYSNLNFGNHIINPKNEEKNQIFEKLSEKNENYLMFIKDPFTGLNVSKSSFRVIDIQKSFLKAASYIINSLYIYNNPQLEKNLESSYTKILSGLLSK